MERELKFRAKRADNKEWIKSLSIVKNPFGKAAFLIDDAIVKEYFKGDASGINMFVKVIPETVGQCTGEFDKNGIEIWEGDILHYYDKGYDDFNDEEWVYDEYIEVKYADTGFGAWGDCDCLDVIRDGEFIEVVGNIYDNPELIK